jgi:predicted NBD/HSP70 family sugar kinase
MIKRRSLLEQHRLAEREEKSFQMLELIRRKGPLTRTELSQGSGCNIVTVSNYVSHFIKQGLVSERGFDVSTGGRKPVLIDLNAKAGFTVGVDLGPLEAKRPVGTGVITDLRGQLVHRVARERKADGMDELLAEGRRLVQEVLDSSPVEAKKLQGIGVGLPGVLDERAGTVRDTSTQGIRANYFTARERWESEFRLPVLIGSAPALAGYGELRLGLDRPVDNLIYLYSDLGASLLLHGHLFWGAGGSAGQLGVFVPSGDDYLMWIKSPSFVLPSAWDLGVPAKARKLLEEGHASTITELAGGSPDGISVDVVIRAAQGGDQVARDLVEHTATQVGIRIATLVNLLNPEVVVIGGGLERAGSMLLEPVWRCVRKYAYEEPASQVDVLPAQLGENAVALGAACWVIREVFVQA